MGIQLRDRREQAAAVATALGLGVWIMSSFGRHPPGSGFGRIAYVAPDASGQSQIFTVTPDGSQQRQLTQTPAAKAFPARSRDRTRIAFSYSLVK